MNNQISYLHISIWKKKYVFVISNGCGNEIFQINSYELGYRNTQKLSVEALMQLLEICFNKIVPLKKPCLFFKLERVTLSDSTIIWKYLTSECKANNIQLIRLMPVKKVVHN